MGSFRKLVIGNDISAGFVICQMLLVDRKGRPHGISRQGALFKPRILELRRVHASKDVFGFIDDDWCNEPKFADAICNLIYLLLESFYAF